MVESTKICWIVVSGVSALGIELSIAWKICTHCVRVEVELSESESETHDKLWVLAGTHFFELWQTDPMWSPQYRSQQEVINNLC